MRELPIDDNEAQTEPNPFETGVKMPVETKGRKIQTDAERELYQKRFRVDVPASESTLRTAVINRRSL